MYKCIHVWKYIVCMYIRKKHSTTAEGCPWLVLPFWESLKYPILPKLDCQCTDFNNGHIGERKYGVRELTLDMVAKCSTGGELSAGNRTALSWTDSRRLRQRQTGRGARLDDYLRKDVLIEIHLLRINQSLRPMHTMFYVALYAKQSIQLGRGTLTQQ